MTEKLKYLTRTLPSGAKITKLDPDQFPVVEPEEEETVEEKLIRVEADIAEIKELLKSR